jgi:hypothetical protein
MIKLIATDVDGTLVKESSREVYPELITVIRKIIDKGVHFVIASGRQYSSISKMFASVNRPMYYIAENGAHILENDKTIGVTKMRREDIEGIMADLRKCYPKCHVVASAPEGSFIESKDERFITMIREQYRNKVILVDDILKADVEYVKLAMYQKGSVREYGEKLLVPKWESKVKTCMAGEEWVDFMDYSVDKGNALRLLQERLDVTPAETMVFGDNQNDIGMLQAAVESYAVETAVKEAKSAAKYICPSYMEKGVFQVLHALYG